MTGRPNEFNQPIADEICDRLSKGESLRTICAGDAQTEGAFMPGRSTVMRWLNEFESFRDQYAHARELQADHYAEEIVDIADCNDVSKLADRDPQRDRLRIDARKWYASKLAPKKYGDKVALTGGGEGDAPLQVFINKPA